MSYTRDEFEAAKHQIECKWCHEPALTVEPPRVDYEGGGRVVCTACNRLQFTLKKDRAEPRRPKLKSGTTEQVWAAWGDCCSHCGIKSDDLEFLGLSRTVQHAPPYKDVGEGGQLIPYCSWCQQDSNSRMLRITALLDRLTQRLLST